MSGDEPGLSSWRAIDAVLYASIGPEDTGPRSGDGAAHQETMVASGKIHLTIGQAWFVGLFVSGEKRSPVPKEPQPLASASEHGRFAFYWALADIDSVAAVKTKKYLKVWDNVF